MGFDAIARAKEWVNNNAIDEVDRLDIKKLIDSNNDKEIVERFYRDLEFGTGGLRAILGNGQNMMNKYNVKKATQAIANVILKLEKPMKKVAISFDSRRMSKEFAKETASVFAGNGITAYIYSRLNPVPMLSFSVRHHKADAGVMITASHNPPEYNGYKAYWNDGSQVTSPHDKNIIEQYNAIVDLYSIKYLDYKIGLANGLIVEVGEDVEEVYFKTVMPYFINKELCHKHGTDLKIVYTPIHGTGRVPCCKLLNDLGLTNYKIVSEQAEPDGNFPTVTSPNPENASALKMAVELMKKENADIVMGTDPDADRLGVAISHKGEVHYLSGNQIGSLMLHYILTNLSHQHKLPENSYVIKTIVTTELQTKIAKHFGVNIYNTLTGFKWICGKVREKEQLDPKSKFLFGTEESFGYLNHPHARDKDAVTAVGLMGEMALWYKRQGMTLIDALNLIYDQFGFSHEDLLCLNYHGKEGAEKIIRIMKDFRSNPPQNIIGDEIKTIEDYQLQTITDNKNNLLSRIDLPRSDVIGYVLASGDKVLLRPSGTEPKIKFYLLLSNKNGTLIEKKKQTSGKAAKIVKYLTERSEKA